MKKSSLIAMLLGVISGVLFALGMCMALIPEWDAFRPGIVFGCVGLLLGLVTLAVWRKMEHKAPHSAFGQNAPHHRHGCCGRFGAGGRNVLLHGLGSHAAWHLHRLGGYCCPALSHSHDKGNS